jgi:hypothetical protein
MKRLISPLFVLFVGMGSLAVPGFGAVTGLIAYPGAVTYQSSTGSTLVRTDSSPIVVASGSGSAGVTVSVNSPTLNVTCGGGTKPWLSASLASGTVTAGGHVGVTISVNPCGGFTNLSGTVTVTTGSTSVTISVTLNFYEGGDATVTSIPSMPLSLGAGTAAQNYIVAFAVAGTPNEAQSSTFQVSAASNNTTNNATWLSAAKNGDASDFAMTVDPSKLSPGGYSGVVTFSGSAGSPILVNIDVTLIVPAKAAAITKLNPASVTAGGAAFTLTVTGSGFVNGGSTVNWNGAPLGTGFVSATQLTASVSASVIAASGTASVTVANSGASASNALSFTISPNAAAPVIVNLSPSSATVGGPAFTLTVTGSGFVAGSNVEWNSAPIATTYVSPTQLTASVSSTVITSPANADITVLNTGGLTSNDVPFPVNSAPPSLLTISHFVDGNGWRSSILLVNNDVVPATYTVSFHNDVGLSYTPILASGITSGTIAVGGSTILQSADSSTTLSSGWAQVSSSQAIGGTAVFRYDPWSQEAAVPLLPSGAMKLEIPYQVANGLTLGVALANPSASTDASITEIIRDLNGNQLASRSFTLQTFNHISFLPTFPAGITGGGVVEYDSNINIYGLGIRSAPEGTGLAFTSLDAVLAQPASTETISHIVDGDGWRSTIILVNTAAVPAVYNVKFWNDSGATYVPPLSSGAVSGTIPVGGSTIIATADTSSTLTTEGWATVTSAQTLGGTAVFRYDPLSQEAAVPLLPSGGVHLEIPYQAGNGLTLGIALANPSATQTANITEIIRDQNGNQLSTRTFTLAPLNHTAFIPTYPATFTGGGVAEYDSNITIYGLGIRSAPEGTGLVFTSVRAVYR